MLQICIIVTLSAEMYVVCNGMLVTILGPTLALNGPKGSMERAVFLMRRERGVIFKMFGFGLIGFFGMIICLSAIYMPPSVAAVCVPISCIAAVYTVVIAKRILRDFSYEEPKYAERVRVGNDSNPLTAKDVAFTESTVLTKNHSGKGNITAAEYLEMDGSNAASFTLEKTDGNKKEENDHPHKTNDTRSSLANVNVLSSVFKKRGE